MRSNRRRERYSRNTQGWNAQGFFSPPLANANSALATEATLADLVYANASKAGTIGLYDATGLLHADLATAGEEIVIAQKNSDGDLKKSTVLTVGNFTAAKTVYSAPVIQQDDVSPLNINIVGGLQEFVLSVRETTPGNQPFPVMEGRAIVRGGTPSDYEIANAIVQDINNSYDFERNADNAFAVVDITSTTATAAFAAGNGTFSKGSNIVQTSADYTGTAPVGTFVGFTTATGVATVVHSWFQVVAITATQITLDRAWPYDYEVIDMAADGLLNAALTVVGIRVSGVDELVHFDTAVSEDLADAVITNTTDWAQGTGAAFQVASMEDECVVFDGQTTINIAWERDFGQADLYVDDSDDVTEYTLYIFESTNRILPSAGAPQNQTLMLANVIIAAAAGSTLETNLDTVLGL